MKQDDLRDEALDPQTCAEELAWHYAQNRQPATVPFNEQGFNAVNSHLLTIQP